MSKASASWMSTPSGSLEGTMLDAASPLGEYVPLEAKMGHKSPDRPSHRAVALQLGIDSSISVRLDGDMQAAMDQLAREQSVKRHGEILEQVESSRQKRLQELRELELVKQRERLARRERAQRRIKESARQERVRRRLIQTLKQSKGVQLSQRSLVRPPSSHSAEFLAAVYDQAQDTLRAEDLAKEAKEGAMRMVKQAREGVERTTRQTTGKEGGKRSGGGRGRGKAGWGVHTRVTGLGGRHADGSPSIDGSPSPMGSRSPDGVHVHVSPGSTGSLAARRTRHSPSERAYRQMVRRSRRQVSPESSPGFSWPPIEETEHLRKNHRLRAWKRAQRKDGQASSAESSPQGTPGKSHGSGTSMNERNSSPIAAKGEGSTKIEPNAIAPSPNSIRPMPPARDGSEPSSMDLAHAEGPVVSGADGLIPADSSRARENVRPSGDVLNGFEAAQEVDEGAEAFTSAGYGRPVNDEIDAHRARPPAHTVRSSSPPKAGDGTQLPSWDNGLGPQIRSRGTVVRAIRQLEDGLGQEASPLELAVLVLTRHTKDLYIRSELGRQALREHSLAAREKEKRRMEAEGRGRPQSAAAWSAALGVPPSALHRQRVQAEYGPKRHPVLQKAAALQRLHETVLANKREARAKGAAGTGAPIDAPGADSSRLVLEMVAHHMAEGGQLEDGPPGYAATASGSTPAGARSVMRKAGAGSPKKSKPKLGWFGAGVASRGTGSKLGEGNGKVANVGGQDPTFHTAAQMRQAAKRLHSMQVLVRRASRRIIAQSAPGQRERAVRRIRAVVDVAAELEGQLRQTARLAALSELERQGVTPIPMMEGPRARARAGDGAGKGAGARAGLGSGTWAGGGGVLDESVASIDGHVEQVGADAGQPQDRQGQRHADADADADGTGLVGTGSRGGASGEASPDLQGISEAIMQASGGSSPVSGDQIADLLDSLEGVSVPIAVSGREGEREADEVGPQPQGTAAAERRELVDEVAGQEGDQHVEVTINAADAGTHSS